MQTGWKASFSKITHTGDKWNTLKHGNLGTLPKIFGLQIFLKICWTSCYYWYKQSIWASSDPEASTDQRCIQTLMLKKLRIQNPAKYLRWIALRNSKWLLVVNYFCKILQLRCLARLWIRLFTLLWESPISIFLKIMRMFGNKIMKSAKNIMATENNVPGGTSGTILENLDIKLE